MSGLGRSWDSVMPRREGSQESRWEGAVRVRSAAGMLWAGRGVSCRAWHQSVAGGELSELGGEES